MSAAFTIGGLQWPFDKSKRRKASAGLARTDETKQNKNNMKIEKLKVEGGYICRNPMTGTWFVWIGESRGAKYMAKDKRDAIRTAKEMGGGNLIVKASTH